MRRIIFAGFALAFAICGAFGAASLSDSAILASEPTFENRVRESLVSTCISVSSEAITGLTGTMPIAVHLKRANYCVSVLAAPDSFKTLFSFSVATDASVLADATVNGTVVLTSGNVAAQAALATDAHIGSAISGQLPAYIGVP